MINKKIISILVLISIFSSTLSYAVTVKDLYPAAKVYNAVSKTWSVPAVIEAVGLNGLAQETVMLSLTKAIMGGVITSLAIAGVGYVANSYIDWLMGNNPSMYYDVDGVLKYDNHATVYSVPAGLLDAASAYAATSLANACPCSCGTGNTVGIVGGSVTSSSHAGYGSVFSHGGWSWNGCIFDWNMWYVDDSSDCPRHRMLYWTAINNACLTAYDSVTKNPVTSPYLNPLNEAAIDSGNSPLNDQSAAAIDKAAQLIAGGIGAAAAAGSLPKKLHDGMVQGISSADAAAVQAAADNKTAAQAAADAAVSGTSSLSQAQLVSALQSQGLSANAIAAAIDAVNKVNSMTAVGIAGAITGALAGQGLTQAQQQAAVAAALAAKLGDDVAVPEDVLPTAPDKKSLSGVMTTFLTALSNIPIMNTLRGLTIQCSGTSTLCLNLPSRLGGNACFNAGGATDGINMAGHALLSLTSLFMFVWIFRG